MKRKRPTSPQSDVAEPQWKTVEKVVALLEKSLAPDARVTHNVKLPCLTTGHAEQCDVLIEMGQEPRVTRTIVEVQRRNERVKPNDFRGWCQKMKDVGANRLICVSAKPFPRSIKDKVAKELGPTVLLVRLEALEARQWPLQIVNNAMKVYKSTVKVNDAIKPNPLLMFSPDNNPFVEYTGELFSSASLPNVIKREGHSELLPVADLVNEGIQLMDKQPKLIRLPEGVHKVRISWKPKDASLCFKDKTAKIQGVKIDYTIESKVISFPFEILSYTQEGHRTLGWVVRATGRLDGEDAEIRFSFVPRSDGSFSMSFPQIFGIKAGVSFFLWYSEADHSG